MLGLDHQSSLLGSEADRGGGRKRGMEGARESARERVNDGAQSAVLSHGGNGGLTRAAEVTEERMRRLEAEERERHRAISGLHCIIGIHSVRLGGPDGQGDRSNYCVPIRSTTQILTQPKNLDNEFKQTMSDTENARLLSKSAVFALWT